MPRTFCDWYGVVHDVDERIERKPWGTFKYHLRCSGENLYDLPTQEPGEVVSCLECVTCPAR